MKIENINLRKQQKVLINEYIMLKTENIHNLRAKLLDEFFGKPMLDLDERYIFPLKSSLISPNGTCYPGLDRLFITTEGKLGMCEKVNEAITFGNVKDGINITKVKNIYNEYCNILNKVCLDCWAYRLCSSCFNGSILNGKISEKRKREDCRYKKSSVVNSLKRYTKIKMQNPEAFKTHSIKK